MKSKTYLNPTWNMDYWSNGQVKLPVQSPRLPSAQKTPDRHETTTHTASLTTVRI